MYVPTTPNPTSGFFLMLPRARVHELDMTVDEALKYIISMGVVAPKAHSGALRAAAAHPKSVYSREIDRRGLRRAVETAPHFSST